MAANCSPRAQDHRWAVRVDLPTDNRTRVRRLCKERRNCCEMVIVSFWYFYLVRALVELDTRYTRITVLVPLAPVALRESQSKV